MQGTCAKIDPPTHTIMNADDGKASIPNCNLNTSSAPSYPPPSSPPISFFFLPCPYQTPRKPSPPPPNPRHPGGNKQPTHRQDRQGRQPCRHPRRSPYATCEHTTDSLAGGKQSHVVGNPPRQRARRVMVIIAERKVRCRRHACPPLIPLPAQ